MQTDPDPNFWYYFDNFDTETDKEDLETDEETESCHCNFTGL